MQDGEGQVIIESVDGNEDSSAQDGEGHAEGAAGASGVSHCADDA